LSAGLIGKGHYTRSPLIFTHLSRLGVESAKQKKDKGRQK
jgi:hypothetical protein